MPYLSEPKRCQVMLVPGRNGCCSMCVNLPWVAGCMCKVALKSGGPQLQPTPARGIAFGRNLGSCLGAWVMPTSPKWAGEVVPEACSACLGLHTCMWILCLVWPEAVPVGCLASDRTKQAISEELVELTDSGTTSSRGVALHQAAMLCMGCAAGHANARKSPVDVAHR